MLGSGEKHATGKKHWGNLGLVRRNVRPFTEGEEADGATRRHYVAISPKDVDRRWFLKEENHGVSSFVSNKKKGGRNNGRNVVRAPHGAARSPERKRTLTRALGRTGD